MEEQTTTQTPSLDDGLKKIYNKNVEWGYKGTFDQFSSYFNENDDNKRKVYDFNVKNGYKGSYDDFISFAGAGQAKQQPTRYQLPTFQPYQRELDDSPASILSPTQLKIARGEIGDGDTYTLQPGEDIEAFTPLPNFTLEQTEEEKQQRQQQPKPQRQTMRDGGRMLGHNAALTRLAQDNGIATEGFENLNELGEDAMKIYALTPQGKADKQNMDNAAELAYDDFAADYLKNGSDQDIKAQLELGRQKQLLEQENAALAKDIEAWKAHPGTEQQRNALNARISDLNKRLGEYEAAVAQSDKAQEKVNEAFQKWLENDDYYKAVAQQYEQNYEATMGDWFDSAATPLYMQMTKDEIAKMKAYLDDESLNLDHRQRTAIKRRVRDAEAWVKAAEKNGWLDKTFAGMQGKGAGIDIATMFRSMGHAIDFDLLDFGIGEAIDDATLRRISEKVRDQGEASLTPEERAVLLSDEALGLTKSVFNVDESAWNAGANTAEMLPFIVELWLSGGANAAIKAGVKGAVKGGAKGFRQGLKAGWRAATKPTASQLGRLGEAGRFAPKSVGQVAKEVGMTAAEIVDNGLFYALTTGSGHTISQLNQYMTPELDADFDFGTGKWDIKGVAVDEQGNIKGGDKFGIAALKAIGMQAIEGGSEMLGEKALQPLLDRGGYWLRGMMGKQGRAMYKPYLRVVDDWIGHGVLKNVSGFGTEYAEELAGSVARVITGLSTWDQEFNKQNLADTAYGLMPAQVAFAVLGGGRMVGHTRRSSQAKDLLDKYAPEQAAFYDRVAQMSTYDGADMLDRKTLEILKTIDEKKNNGTLTEEDQRKAAAELGMIFTMQEQIYMDEASAYMKDKIGRRTYEAITSNLNENGMFTVYEWKHDGTTERVPVLSTKDGKATIRLWNGKKQTVDLKDLSFVGEYTPEQAMQFAGERQTEFDDYAYRDQTTPMAGSVYYDADGNIPIVPGKGEVNITEVADNGDVTFATSDGTTKTMSERGFYEYMRALRDAYEVTAGELAAWRVEADTKGETAAKNDDPQAHYGVGREARMARHALVNAIGEERMAELERMDGEQLTREYMMADEKTQDLMYDWMQNRVGDSYGEAMNQRRQQAMVEWKQRIGRLPYDNGNCTTAVHNGNIVIVEDNDGQQAAIVDMQGNKSMVASGELSNMQDNSLDSVAAQATMPQQAQLTALEQAYNGTTFQAGQEYTIGTDTNGEEMKALVVSVNEDGTISYATEYGYDKEGNPTPVARSVKVATATGFRDMTENARQQRATQEQGRQEAAQQRADMGELRNGQSVTIMDEGHPVQGTVNMPYTGSQSVFTDSGKLVKFDTIDDLKKSMQDAANALQAEQQAIQAAVQQQKQAEIDAQSAMEQEYQRRLDEAKTPKERAQVIQEYLDQIKTEDFTMITNDNLVGALVESMVSRGVKQEDAVRLATKIQNDIQRANQTQQRVRGFNHPYTGICIHPEDIVSIEDARTAYIHERQHTITRNNVSLQDAVLQAASKDELDTYIAVISGTPFYKGSDAATVASEFLSMAMELAYKTSNVEAALRQLGIENNALIQIITQLDNEQRTDEHLSKSRRAAHVDGSQQRNDRNDDKDAGGEPRRVEGQGSRPVRGGNEPPAKQEVKTPEQLLEAFIAKHGDNTENKLNKTIESISGDIRNLEKKLATAEQELKDLPEAYNDKAKKAIDKKEKFIEKVRNDLEAARKALAPYTAMKEVWDGRVMANQTRLNEADQALQELDGNPNIAEAPVTKEDKEPANGLEFIADQLTGFAKKEYRINKESLKKETGWGDEEAKRFAQITTVDGGMSVQEMAEYIYGEAESEGHEHGWFKDPMDARDQLLDLLQTAGDYGGITSYISENRRRAKADETQMAQQAMDYEAHQLGYENAQDMPDKRMAEAQAKLEELKDEQGNLSEEALQQFKDFTQGLMIGQEQTPTEQPTAETPIEEAPTSESPAETPTSDSYTGEKLIPSISPDISLQLYIEISDKRKKSDVDQKIEEYLYYLNPKVFNLTDIQRFDKTRELVEYANQHQDNEYAKKVLDAVEYIKSPFGTPMESAVEGGEYYQPTNEEAPFSVVLPIDKQTPKNTTIDQVLYSIKVNHNSPYLLKKADGSFIDPETGERLGFDHRFMSTGEGIQAHGWGSYFSVEDLRHYADDLNNPNTPPMRAALRQQGRKWLEENPTFEAWKETKEFKDYYYNHEDSAFKYIEELKTRGPEWQADIKDIEKRIEERRRQREDEDYLRKQYNIEREAALTQSSRHHYDVEIPDNDNDNYLEEDGVLSVEDNAILRNELEKEILKRDEDGAYKGHENDLVDELKAAFPDNITGRNAYGNVSTYLGGDEQASKFLKEMGYYGIHYDGQLDGECYVIFDENDAKIVDHVMFSVTGMITNEQGEIDYDRVTNLAKSNEWQGLSRLPQAYRQSSVPATAATIISKAVPVEDRAGSEASRQRGDVQGVRQGDRGNNNQGQPDQRGNGTSLGRLNEVIQAVQSGQGNVSRIPSGLRQENESVPAIAAQAIAKGYFASKLARIGEIHNGASQRDERGTGRGAAQRVPELEPQDLRGIRGLDSTDRDNVRDLIKQWAKDNGYWYDEERLQSLGDELKGGTESRVFRSEDGTTISKSTNAFNYQGNVQLVIESMEMFGKVFPNTPYTIIGFSEDKDGHLCVVATQPYVQGMSLDEYAAKQGWYDEDGYIDYDRKMEHVNERMKEQYGLDLVGAYAAYENDTYHVFDVHRGNYIVDDNGDVYVIDADITLNDESDYLDNGVRFSVVTPQQDADYMDAVNRGDMETAQRMVLEAAKAAMPNTKVVDENGNPKVVYHGTNKGVFTVFKEGNFDGIYFTDNIDVAAGYTKGSLSASGTIKTRPNLRKVELDELVNTYIDNLIKSPLVTNASYQIENGKHIITIEDIEEDAPQVFRFDTEKEVREFIEGNMFVYPVFLDIQNPFIDNANGESYGVYNLDGVVHDVKRKGVNDGVVINNIQDHPTITANDYIVFSPSQIKSADPVTYDDQGNVIPLSQRFNERNDDIRYSVVSPESQAIFDKAKEIFGTTTDIREAGYVLPDGSMLDFSGRHGLNEGDDDSFLRGERTSDHRDIQQIEYEKDGNTPSGVNTDMPDFIRRGAIRIDSNAGVINLYVKPTKEQRWPIRRIVEANDGDVQVDFGDGWDSDHYVEYDGAKPSRVLADIDRYFDEGIKPEGNMMFSIVGQVINRNGDINYEELDNIIRSQRNELAGLSRIPEEAVGRAVATPAIAAEAIARGVRQANLAEVWGEDGARENELTRYYYGTNRRTEEESDARTDRQLREVRGDDAGRTERTLPEDGRRTDGSLQQTSESNRGRSGEDDGAALWSSDRDWEQTRLLIKQWAQRSGYWYDDARLSDDATEREGGTESRVFVTSDNKKVRKLTSAVLFSPERRSGSVQELSESAMMFSNIFRDTPLTIVGFGENGNGELCIVTEQPFIEGQRLGDAYPNTTERKKVLDDYMFALGGFVPSDINEYSNEDYVVWDVNKDNVIVDGAGQLHVIDAGVELADPSKYKGEPMYSFIGRSGAQRLDLKERAMTRLNNLHVARQMEEQGKDAKTIKLATGWERGKDGKWRYEIMDFAIDKDSDFGKWIAKRAEARAAHLRKAFRKADKLRQEALLLEPLDDMKLEDILEKDSEIFKAYPQLKDYKLKTYFEQSATGGWHDRKNKTINLNKALLNEDGIELSTLAHEIQHVIQNIEGFAVGGSPSGIAQAVKDMNNNAKIWSYKQMLDEVAKDSPEHADDAEALLKDILEGLGYDTEVYRVIDTDNGFEYVPKAEYEARQDGFIPEENLRKQAFKIYQGKIKGDTYEKAYKQWYNKMKEAETTTYYEGTPFELYKRLAGETEARNVQTRLGFTEEQRRQLLAAETEDVAREDQLVMFAGDPVLYSVSQAANTPQERLRLYDAMVGTKEVSSFVGRVTEGFYQSVVDGAIPLKRLQDVIAGRGKVTDAENAYLMEIARAARAKRLTDIAEKEYYEPMMKAIAALTGRTSKKGYYKAMRDVELYVLAKSGLERNQWFWDEAKKSDPNAQLVDKSGLTALAAEFGEKDFTAFAQRLVADYEARHGQQKIDELWKCINAVSKNILDTELDGHLISQELHDDLLNRWKFYVPMRGFDEQVTSAFYAYQPSSATIRFENPFKKIKGRVSLADNPFVNLIRMTESAINLKGKNEVGLALLNLAASHDDNGLLRVGKAWEVKEVDPATGEVTWKAAYPNLSNVSQADIPAAIDAFQKSMMRQAKTGDARPSSRTAGGVRIHPSDIDQHVLKVKVGGQTVDLYLLGNPKAFQALNPTGKSKVGEKLSGLTRSLSGLMTTYNPVFMVRNSIRDFKTASIITYTRDGAAGMFNMMGQWFGNMNALRKLIKGESSGDATLDRYWQEFLEFGGETGFTRSLNMEKQREDFNKKMFNLTRDKSGQAMHKITHWYFDWMSQRGNRYAEDITRFAVFCASRKQGRSAMQAAADAKNTTANFNKKGQSGFARFMSTNFAFFNAAIQGLNTSFHAFKDNPGRAATAAVSTMIYSMAIPFVNMCLLAMFGDDDDWRQYENMTQFVSNTHAVYYIPGAGFLTMPYPQDFVPFTSLGNIIWRNAAGFEKPLNGRSIFGNVMLQWFDTWADLLPVNAFEEGFGEMKDWKGVARALAPTWLSPVADVMLNRNFMGSQIRRKHFTLNDQKDLAPYWAEYDRSKNWWAHDIARLIAGGDEYRAGAAWRNVDPRQIIHLVEGYGGGTVKLVSDIMVYFEELAKGDKPTLNQAPFIKKFWIQPNPDKYEGNLNGKLYEMAKYQRELEQQIKDLQKEADKAHEDGNDKAAEKRENKIEEIRNSKEYKILTDYDVNGMMKDWRDERNDITNNETLSEEGKQDKIVTLTYRKAAFLDGIWEELFLGEEAPKQNWFSDFYRDASTEAYTHNRKEGE